MASLIRLLWPLSSGFDGLSHQALMASLIRYDLVEVLERMRRHNASAVVAVRLDVEMMTSDDL